MQTDIIYTYTLAPGQVLYLWFWTSDWGTFNAFQAAPSLNQGFNSGQVSLLQVQANMPVAEPNFASLAYVLTVQNTGGSLTMTDIYNAWQ